MWNDDSQLILPMQNYERGLEGIILEARKYVDVFGYPISQSVPHIYLSALPFSPPESVVLQYMRIGFQNTLSVEAGSLKHWPVIHQTLTGHSDDVLSVVFSPNGTRIVSVSGAVNGTLWDAMSGAPIGELLKRHSASIQSVTYSPDGTRIISGSDDKTVRIWDVMSGAPIGEPLQGHSDLVRSIAFSPDGTRIASGFDDETVQIWDAVSGAPIGEPLRGHSDSVQSVAFSPDSTRIVSGSDDETVRIWDAVLGAPIGEPLQGHSARVWSVAFSPDGTCIVSGFFDKTIRIWDAAASSKHTPEHSAAAPHIVAYHNGAGISSPTRETIQSSANPVAAMSPVQNAIFSDGSVLHDDGWVTTSGGLLLFWVPPEHRLGLFWPHTLTVIGAQPTRLNMQRFVHGPQWTQCRTGDC